MIIRKFWDSDRVFRHSVVYRYLELCGYNVVLSNNEPPRISISNLRKNFGEINDIIYGPGRGSVDFDALAYNDTSLVIGEVKTRLIPRIFKETRSLETVRKFIEYHISDPINAKKFWDYLKSMGKIQRYLDNETSISELGKELLGVIVKEDIRGLFNKSTNIYVGLFTIDMFKNASYYNELLNDILNLIEWFVSVLKNKGMLYDKKFGAFIVLFRPRGFTDTCVPSSFDISVLGDKICSSNTELLKDIEWGIGIAGCDKCNYKKYCRILMGELGTKCLR